MKYFLVFVAMVAIDFCWAHYINYVNSKQPGRAANWSALISLLSSLAVLTYTQDHWALPAVIAGSWVGTFAAVWWRAHMRFSVTPWVVGFGYRPGWRFVRRKQSEFRGWREAELCLWFAGYQWHLYYRTIVK